MMFQIHICILVLAVTIVMTRSWVASDKSVLNVNRTALIDQERRVERSATLDQKNCETWAPWVNDNHPTPSNQEDSEVIPPQTLRDFCPVGRITKFECKDNSGEPFNINRTDPNGVFVIFCYYVGVRCKLIFPIRLCPDFAIRYFCTCKPLTSTTNSEITISTAIMTFPADVSLKSTDDPGTSEKGTTHSGTGSRTKAMPDMGHETMLRIGNFSLPWWGFVIIFSGLMFIINTGISVCLYRKRAQGRKKQHQRKIVPVKNARCSIYE